MKTVLNPRLVNRAVDIYATTPNVQHKDVADDLGISYKTLLKLRKDADFWDKVYKAYLIEYESEMPDVLRALIRESKAGNVQAIRLVLEHTNRLQKHINIRISSPFEQWLTQSGNNQIEQSRNDSGFQDILDAEVVVDELPPRTADNTPKKVQNDFVKLDKELQKKQAWNERRRQLHKWNNRAKTVNIDPLPARRPTPGQREEWEDSIVKAEGL